MKALSKRFPAGTKYIAIYFTFLMIFFMTDMHAQETVPQLNNDTAAINSPYQLHIKGTNGSIKLDGILDDESWHGAEATTDF